MPRASGPVHSKAVLSRHAVEHRRGVDGRKREGTLKFKAGFAERFASLLVLSSGTMTFLPVVQRELRVASRERNTYRLRFLAALLPVIFCVFSLWVVVLLREEPIPSRGLFFAITWIAYVFVSIAGFCLTADTIAEEKRDSTLGLLFLTDLKGYDIVLGKWSGAGLRGLYALFATFPVLALPLIMGGSGVGEICRTTFILVLALLLSMSVGIVCSTLLRKTWAAAGLSFVLMLAL